MEGLGLEIISLQLPLLLLQMSLSLVYNQGYDSYVQDNFNSLAYVTVFV